MLIKRLAFSVFCCLFNLFALAQTDADSVRVLFIGNSYTYYHDLSNMVQKIASTIANDYRMKLSCTALTSGGYTFKKHLERNDEKNAIKKGCWDYVVLQEQSSAPAMPTSIVQRETYTYARQLDSLIHAYNPHAKVIFYMTWGHKDGCQDNHDGYPLIDTYKGMQHRLITSYLEMAYMNNAWCAPVGMDWNRVREEHPYANLYWPDGSHPSVLGTYLAANVIFATLFQRHYQTTFLSGIDSEMAEYIQQVAQNMVLNNKILLNIEN